MIKKLLFSLFALFAVSVVIPSAEAGGTNGDIFALQRSGTGGAVAQTVVPGTPNGILGSGANALEQYLAGVAWASGTNTAGSLPVADALTTFYSLSVSGSGAEYIKYSPTLLNLAGSGTLTAVSSVNALVSGSTILLGPAGTITYSLTTGTTTFVSTSGSTALTGTSFTLRPTYGDTVAGSGTLTNTGWWLSTSGTGPVQ